MHSYQVLITLGNRQRAVMSGIFSSDCDAIDMAFLIYEDEGVLAAVPRRREVA